MAKDRSANGVSQGSSSSSQFRGPACLVDDGIADGFLRVQSRPESRSIAKRRDQIVCLRARIGDSAVGQQHRQLLDERGDGARVNLP
jgi:hypothetical protein